MSQVLLESFDAQDLTQKGWATTGTPTVSTATQSGSGACLQYTCNGFNLAKRTFTAQTEVYFGFRWYAQSLGSGFNLPMCVIQGDAGATTHLYIGVNGSNAKYSVTLGAHNGTSLGLSSALYTAGSWVYVEVYATIADSGGRCRVNVDGTTVIDFTGDTKNAGTATTIDAITFGSVGGDYGLGANAFRVDDFYLFNGSGSTQNGNIGADCQVLSTLPAAAGSSTQFTANGVPNNWDNVNDVPANDSQYNWDTVSGHRDTYNYTDLATSRSINCVQLVTRMSKSDAGAVSAKAAIKSGATIAYGATRTLSQTATTYTDALPTDPNTGAAWTLSNLNAAEFGAEVV